MSIATMTVPSTPWQRAIFLQRARWLVEEAQEDYGEALLASDAGLRSPDDLPAVALLESLDALFRAERDAKPHRSSRR